ncbi:MAG: hypothetical protein F6K42_31375 [Leptolyngbya sp. SIO1D8]|nr:hypothetical protein [Leptolyngbya sp. SIO1D8]
MVDKSSLDLKKLNAFLKKNKAVDFRVADLLHSPNLDAYKWPGSKAERADLLNQIKAYQRMLRVVPEGREDLAKKLLKAGVYSSLQITNTPKKVFIQTHLKLFDNDSALAEQIYLRAMALRKAVALQYIARIQQTEPHIRTAGLVH